MYNVAALLIVIFLVISFFKIKKCIYLFGCAGF